MEAEGGRISVRGEVAGGINAAVRMIFVGPEVAEGIEVEAFTFAVGMRCCVICCCRRARDAREGRQVLGRMPACCCGV